MSVKVSRPGLFVVVWGLAVAAAAACSSKSNVNNGTSSGGASDAGGGEAAAPTTPEGMFRAFQAEFVSTCGGVGGQCHVNGTFMSAPPWLGPPDPYVSAKQYPGNIPASNDPLDSKLLTQVAHEGPALISNPTLFDKVRDWVVAEVSANGAKLPATTPQAIVDGNNEIDLSALAGGLAGTKLTFTASHSAKILTILDMQITAPFPKALHIETPFFVIIPSNGPTITDTVDGFPGPLDVPNGQTVDFYGGSAVLTKWDPAGKLKIVFTKFDAIVPNDGGGPPQCAALDVFKSSATPALKLDLGGYSCAACHGGGSGPAQFAMDLAALDSDPATACAQVRNRITPKNPSSSQILQTPTGDPAGDPSHPVRSVCPNQTQNDGGAALCVPQAFIDGMTAWINAETP